MNCALAEDLGKKKNLALPRQSIVMRGTFVVGFDRAMLTVRQSGATPVVKRQFENTVSASIGMKPDSLLPNHPTNTGIPISGQINHTKSPITAISKILAGIPAAKNSPVLNWPLS